MPGVRATVPTRSRSTSCPQYLALMVLLVLALCAVYQVLVALLKMVLMGCLLAGYFFIVVVVERDPTLPG